MIQLKKKILKKKFELNGLIRQTRDSCYECDITQ
jgi:hypothetical protein